MSSGAIGHPPLNACSRRGTDTGCGLAESFNGLYKWELIYLKGRWRAMLLSGAAPL
jgi:hypothetical protein